MKYVKYLFATFLVLTTVLLGVSSVKAQEVPTGVNSIERRVNYWEYVGTSSGQILIKSNRFHIGSLYDYFLFDLKNLAGRSNPGGAFGSSVGIMFYTSSSSTTHSNRIDFDEFNFDNFIDMSNETNRWIEFTFVHTMQYNDTVESYLNYVNITPGYDLSVLAISGNGIIVEDNLYTYLTDYVDSVISNRIENAYQNGYDNAKNEFGYNDNGIIVSGQSAYNKGYAIATQDSEQLKTEIINFVPGVLGSIFMFFFQLGQIGILGITILDVIGIFVLISGLVFLIKFFF